MRRLIKKLLFACMAMLVMNVMFSNTVNAQQIILETQYAENVYETYDDELAEGLFRYTVENGMATITKYVGEEENVIVPATIGGYPVKTIANYTFLYNWDVKSIIFSEGIEKLEDFWIQSCIYLESIHIPSTIKMEYDYINWSGASKDENPKLKTITVDENNKYITSYNGDLYSKDMKIFIFHPPADTKEKIVIPEGVITIGSKAFYNAKYVTEVVMPNTVMYIKWSSFCWSEVKKINISKFCASIDAFAFMGTAIESIHIPVTLTDITEGAFSQNAYLKDITVDAGNKVYCVKAGCLYSKVDDSIIAYPGGSTTEIIQIPTGTKRIGDNVFFGIETLKKIILPNTVTEIGEYSFYGCNNLTQIRLPENLQEIGDSAFGACERLTEIFFMGNAPKFEYEPLRYLTATIYYPEGNATWTEEVKQSYGGNNIVWKAYDPTYETPEKPYKITNVVSGVHVYWKAVEDAKKYGVWRSETGKDGTYKWLANPTVPHFTDTKVESGKTYYYRISTLSVSGKTHSEKSEPISINYVSTPDITSRINKAAGVQLGWNKIVGATGYAIYRKSYNGSDAWVRVGTISGNSTFMWTDTTVKSNNGTLYRYTMRALAGQDRKTLSGCRNVGRTMARLTSRTLNSANKQSATSIKCNWTTSAQVTGYEVRFMVGNKVYKTYTVGNYKTGTKTFTGLKTGQTYKIQIRSYKKVDGVGTFYSAWSVAKSVGL